VFFLLHYPQILNHLQCTQNKKQILQKSSIVPFGFCDVCGDEVRDLEEKMDLMTSFLIGSKIEVSVTITQIQKTSTPKSFVADRTVVLCKRAAVKILLPTCVPLLRLSLGEMKRVARYRNQCRKRTNQCLWGLR
jgi:hypothetical protein